ncbi:septum formation initiator family protein [Veillonella montpellierensis]|uniref:septum formation initiator family protein n=1 Tax=Veillonella montpellierensis TaxID=187328 RepID=UPI0023F7C941|nr:septum formation initiator family protein [Veillonella montpellierensis]
MLARKAFGDTKTSIYAPRGVIGARQNNSFILDLTPTMKRTIPILILIGCFLGAILFLRSLSVASGYDVVKLQNNVIELTKQQEALEVEVATLKSPTRIQKIAQDTLGMVLPNRFVYNSKYTTTERNTKKTQQIVD